MTIPRQTIGRWGRLLSTFFAGQGASQILQFITGFALINWLTKDAYATFTLVMAIQGTTQALVELGITQSLTGLIGKKVSDPRAVGRYIAACRYYRDRLLWAGALALPFVFWQIAPNYGWTGGVWLWLWASVVIALVFQAWGAMYNPIFLLNQDLKPMYGIQLSAAVMRLGLIGGAHLAGVLTAPLALFYGALQSMAGGWATRSRTRSAVREPARGEDIRPEKRELLRQSLPRVPSSVFHAFEGQITIYLISIFGNTSDTAELGALGRLAMLFVIFKRGCNVLVGPYFAKLDTARVPGRIALFLLGGAVFTVAVSGFGYLFPEVLLFVLGDGYQHLRYEVFLILLTGSIQLVNMMLFAICVARKYIFPWYSIVEIVPLVAVMVLGFAFLDLSELVQVLYFGIALAVSKTGSRMVDLTVGLRRDFRKPGASSGA